MLELIIAILCFVPVVMFVRVVMVFWWGGKMCDRERNDVGKYEKEY